MTIGTIPSKAAEYDSSHRGIPNPHQGTARIHRMSRDAVNSGVDYRLLPLFLMLHLQRREGVFPKGQVDNCPTGEKKDKPRGRNEKVRACPAGENGRLPGG